jgi:hypothetical protein
MADKPADKPPTERPNEINLTPDDERALDRAWETITDAEIEASVRWTHEQREPTLKGRGEE